MRDFLGGKSYRNFASSTSLILGLILFENICIPYSHLSGVLVIISFRQT